ncbi:hypothetical protein SASPL_149215 [Salvia splendens]|uniref:Uncharacterized protein n=1 Tax=Salvia splendens TaxID=180675 RepID=A0A8X8WBB2_SALSN|nr:hypothetical protein SASPL_149215 [Salvia splendens]
MPSSRCCCPSFVMPLLCAARVVASAAVSSSLSFVDCRRCHHRRYCHSKPLGTTEQLLLLPAGSSSFAFFRQFYPAVAKVDYLALRHGFATEHLSPQVKESFDFQKYINRALEEDFKVIVGISPASWFGVGFWMPFISLIIILLVGAKLQVIITKMGTRILEKGHVVQGNLLVRPTKDLFWFRRPQLLLFLIHFVLFENAFQIALLAWSWEAAKNQAKEGQPPVNRESNGETHGGGERQAASPYRHEKKKETSVIEMERDV